MKIKKISVLMIITVCTLVLSACSSVFPMYYSEKQMIEFAGQIFDAPSFLSSEKNGDMRVYNFEDRDGRPFSLYTYKYNVGFFKPEDISFLYEKAFNDTYEIDIFEYEEENITNIIDSYGIAYEIDNKESDNLKNCQLYIIVNDEFYDNPDAISEKLVPMLTEIDEALNYNYDIKGIGEPSDFNYTSCRLQCIISMDNTGDDNIITRISFSTNEDARLNSEQMTNDLTSSFEHYFAQ